MERTSGSGGTDSGWGLILPTSPGHQSDDPADAAVPAGQNAKGGAAPVAVRSQLPTVA